jgi:hypothetical protein
LDSQGVGAGCLLPRPVAFGEPVKHLQIPVASPTRAQISRIAGAIACAGCIFLRAGAH